MLANEANSKQIDYVDVQWFEIRIFNALGHVFFSIKKNKEKLFYDKSNNK